MDRRRRDHLAPRQVRARAVDVEGEIHRQFTGVRRFGFVVRVRTWGNAPGSSHVKSLLSAGREDDPGGPGNHVAVGTTLARWAP